MRTGGQLQGGGELVPIIVFVINSNQAVEGRRGHGLVIKMVNREPVLSLSDIGVITSIHSGLLHGCCLRNFLPRRRRLPRLPHVFFLLLRRRLTFLIAFVRGTSRKPPAPAWRLHIIYNFPPNPLDLGLPGMPCPKPLIAISYLLPGCMFENIFRACRNLVRKSEVLLPYFIALVVSLEFTLGTHI